ncbi:MAG: 3-methyl-2-oxobutanoate hydroxymethyltransferase [Bryobacteraceae bacterium]
MNKLRITHLIEKKRQGEKLTMLTAYDATMARLMDRAGIDMLLVGDSLGMVILGHDTTLPVTMDAAVHHTRAVANGARSALVVGDMPFLSYQASMEQAVTNAGRLMREGGAGAVKVEGREFDAVRRLTSIGIPVMGHLGMTPQAVHQIGGFRRVAKKPGEAERLVEDAQALEAAGAFAVVLEMIPSEVARAVTAAIAIPTIGIGAGPHCDGQVLVSYDAFGLFDEFVPSFVKRYAELGQAITEATARYVDEVRKGQFPENR